MATVRPQQHESSMENLSQIPQLTIIRNIFKSSLVFPLQDPEFFNLRCIKHTFTNILVLQFDFVNAMANTLLENFRVEIEPPESYVIMHEASCPRLRYKESGTTYTVLKYPEDVRASVGVIFTTLKFTAHYCDFTTGINQLQSITKPGYDDEDDLMEVDVTLADQVQGIGNRGLDFDAAWEAAAAEGFAKRKETFALGPSVTSLGSAIQSLTGFLGLDTVDGTNRVQSGTMAHTLLLCGIFRGGQEVIARARFALSGSLVTMQLSVFCEDPDVAELIISSVGESYKKIKWDFL